MLNFVFRFQILVVTRETKMIFDEIETRHYSWALQSEFLKCLKNRIFSKSVNLNAIQVRKTTVITLINFFAIVLYGEEVLQECVFIGIEIPIWFQIKLRIVKLSLSCITNKIFYFLGHCLNKVSNIKVYGQIRKYSHYFCNLVWCYLLHHKVKSRLISNYLYEKKV